MKTPILLSLGSNLGDRDGNLRTALEQLEEAGISVTRRSSLYETEPVDLQEQPNFVNLACEVKTHLSPDQLLETCLAVERKMGRKRRQKWGPRTIDIDILFYGHEIIDQPRLRIPHPRLRQRRFVLIPLEETHSSFRDPETGKTVTQLCSLCPDRSWVRRIEGP